MDSQSIVFAFYKNDKLIGYRLDTVGSIGMKGAKIYEYSKKQVDTVLGNINYNVKNDKGFGDILGIKEVAEREKEINQLLQDKKVFEVRVLKCPSKIYEKSFDVQKAEWVTDIWGEYPHEEMEVWLQNPEDHECIETHFFSSEGLMCLS